MDAFAIITLISLLVAALAVVANQTLGKNCRALQYECNSLRDQVSMFWRRDEKKRLEEEFKFERASMSGRLTAEKTQTISEVISRCNTLAADLRRSDDELRKYKLAELKDKPFVIGSNVQVKGFAIYGHLTDYVDGNSGRIWELLDDADPQRRVQTYVKSRYHESLLEHWIP